MYRDLVRLVFFMRRMEVDVRYFVLSVSLLVLLVFFQIYTIELLYALVNCIIRQDFSFVKEVRLVGRVVRWFPEIFAGGTALFILLVSWNYLVTILRNLLQYGASLTTSYQAKRASTAMRRLIFDRYLNFGKLFFDRNNIASLNHVILTSTDTITTQLVTFQQMLTQLLTLAVYVGLMCSISWPLTLAVGAIFPVMNFASLYLIKKIQQNSVAHEKDLHGLNKIVFNILTCIPLVKGYGKEEVEKRYFADVSSREVKTAFSMAQKQHLIAPVQDISQTTALLLAAWTLALVGAKQGLDASKIFIFFFLANRSVPMFNALNSFRLSLAGIEGPIKRIEELLNDKDKFIVPDGNRRFDGLRERVEFRNLNFSYVPGLAVLRNASFSIGKGQVLAIVGATGAGKTTLTNLFLRFYDCPPGTIFVDGVDIREFTARSLREHMAFVSQEVFIFNDTIRMNIAYALTEDRVSDDQLVPILKRSRLYDFVKDLPDGLETVVGDNGVKLSGGEKQRIALARALLKDAPILILDEATSSLDSMTEHLIQEALDETVQGRTTIIIAHRLSTIRRADKIVVLEKGHVIEEGSLAELLAFKGRFHEFWDTQKLGTELKVGS